MRARRRMPNLRRSPTIPSCSALHEAPRALSEAHAVGAAIGLSADALGIAIAELAAMSERRIDRLVNPLVSGLPAFLASDSGVGSGFMIAQYTAVALAARESPPGRAGESRRRHHVGFAGGSPVPRDAGCAQAARDPRQRRDHPCDRAARGGAGLRSAARRAGTRAADRMRSTARCASASLTTADDRPLAGDIERARRIARRSARRLESF